MKETPKPCPFCAANLEYCEHEAAAIAGRPVLRYWKHPRNGCFADGFEIGLDEIAAWNQRQS